MNFNSKLAKSLMLVLLMLLPLSLLAAGSISSLALASPGPGWELRGTISNVGLFSIAALDESTAWASGRILFSPGGIYKTTDGGTTWTAQSTGVAFSTASVVNASIVYAAGLGNVLKTTDGGTTWNSIFPIDPTFYARSIRAFDAENVVVGGDVHTPEDTHGRACVAKSSDGGATWNIVYLASTQSVVDDMSAPSPQVIWLKGKLDGGTTATPDVIIKTPDGGTTWNQVTGVEPGTNSIMGVSVGYSISALDANTAWTYRNVYDTSWVTDVLKTTDGGANWVSQYSFNGYYGLGITPVDANVVWVGFNNLPGSYSGGIIKSTNGGTSWTTQLATSNYAVGPVSAINSSIGWALGGSSTTVPTTVTIVFFRTTDGGGPGLSSPTIASVAPTNAGQYAFFANLTIAGTGFQPGASVRLEKGGSVINASSVSVDSDKQLTTSLFLFGNDPGAYDVVVINPDGGEGRLGAGFNVTSACGAGSGSAVLMLGLALGLLSLAGSFKVRRKRR